MKVAKKVRLLMKDREGNFIKNDTYETLRSRMVIQESEIQEKADNYKETGILYIVDNAATQEWLDSKTKGKAPKKEVETLEIDGLVITEENVDQFAEDNDIKFGVTKDPQKKLNKVKEFINKQ